MTHKKRHLLLTVLRSRFFWSGIILLLFFATGASISYISRSLDELQTGIQELQTAKAQLLIDTPKARAALESAQTHLLNANTILLQAPLYTKLLTPIPPFSYQVELIKASYNLAQSGKITLEMLDAYPKFANQKQDVSATVAINTQNFVLWYTQNQPQITSLKAKLETANRQLQTIPAWIAGPKAKQLQDTQSAITKTTEALTQANGLIDAIRLTLGLQDSNPHSWALLFQNDAELRPTGGFIGSFATLTGSTGTLRNFQFGTNIYKLDKAFTAKTPIPAPEPLNYVSPTLALRDSNFGSGFLPDMAPGIADLYTKETGTALEGIVFLDGMLVRNLLRLTGPISPTNSTITVDYDNFVTKLAQQIELDYYKLPANKIINEPKSILNDLIPPLIEKLFQIQDPFTSLLPVLESAVDRKDIQIWSTNHPLQAKLQSLLPNDLPPSGNWLKIQNSNLGGAKSSINVWQQTKIIRQADSFTLEITRTHKGTGVFPDANNQNFLEIYLPPTAKILELPTSIGGVSGLPQDIQVQLGIWLKPWVTTTDESPNGWRRVRLFATTNVAQTTTYTLKYTALPETGLTILKQAGSSHESIEYQGQSYNLESNLTLP